MMKLSLISGMVGMALMLGACGSDAETEEAPATGSLVEQGAAPAGSTADNPAQPVQAAEQPVQPEVPAGPTTTMTFKYLEYDFGTVKDGDVVRHDYEFTNTGTEPLIISDAKASCGCTVPQWPKEPIQPGGKGKIRVEFDSKGKPGPQSKRVTITANTTPSPIFLTIKGTVEGKAAAAK